MHLELVSHVRCPRPHADGWLVASVSRVNSRYIEEGLLGCPTCGAEYAIRRGVTYMSAPDGDVSLTRAASRHAHLVEASSDPVRTAAMLGVDASSQLFALVGHTVAHAAALQVLAPVSVLVVNPNDAQSMSGAVAPAAVMMVDSSLSLAANQFNGILLAQSAVEFAEMAVQALKTNGRLVAPVSSPMPSNVRELARDDEYWVAERLAIETPPIGLTRR